MAQHKISPEGWRHTTAEILDFEAARLSRRLATTQAAAADALGAVRAGQISLDLLLRTLISPFNSDLH